MSITEIECAPFLPALSCLSTAHLSVRAKHNGGSKLQKQSNNIQRWLTSKTDKQSEQSEKKNTQNMKRVDRKWEAGGGRGLHVE